MCIYNIIYMCPAAAAASMCNNNIIMGGIRYFHYTSTHSAFFVAFSSSLNGYFYFILFLFWGVVIRSHSSCRSSSFLLHCVGVSVVVVVVFLRLSSLICVYICARRDQTTTHLIQCQSGHSFLSRIPCGAFFSFACFFFFFTSCCIPLISHNFVKWWERGCTYSNVGVFSPINPEIEYSLHNHFDSRLQFCACVYTSLGWAVIYSHAGQVEKYFFESSGPFFFFFWSAVVVNCENESGRGI